MIAGAGLAAAAVILLPGVASAQDMPLSQILIEGEGLDGDVELALVRADDQEMPGVVLGPLVRSRGPLQAEDGAHAVGVRVQIIRAQVVVAARRH